MLFAVQIEYICQHSGRDNCSFYRAEMDVTDLSTFCGYKWIIIPYQGGKKRGRTRKKNEVGKRK